MNYCRDASRLLGKKVICGRGCPILEDCPRLIMEDATDKAIEDAIEAMVQAMKKGGEHGIKNIKLP